MEINEKNVIFNFNGLVTYLEQKYLKEELFACLTLGNFGFYI